MVTRCEDCIGMAALWYKSHLFLLFSSSCTLFSLFFYVSIPPPPPLCHCLNLPLCLGTIFSSSLLPLCLSSLQEVLELAFSVLYESDEYLNFIAPDKHEVSRTAAALRLFTASDRMNTRDRTQRLFFILYIYIYILLV